MFSMDQVCGIIIPPVTPLWNDGRVDYVACQAILDIIVKGGCTGVLINGSTCEFARFTDGDRRQLTCFWADQAKGRLARYLNISDSGTARVLENYKTGRESDPDVYVTCLPYYYATLRPAEQLRFFEAVAKAVDKPMMLYNIPQNANAMIAPEAVKEVARWGEVIGIKDSSGNMDYFKQIMEYRTDSFRVLGGAEAFFYDMYAMGADGGVPSGGAFFPGVYVKEFEAVKAGKLSEASEMQQLINKLNCYNQKTQSSLGVVALRKHVMKRLKICGDKMTEPFAPLPVEMLEDYDRRLDEIIPLLTAHEPA